MKPQFGECGGYRLTFIRACSLIPTELLGPKPGRAGPSHSRERALHGSLPPLCRSSLSFSSFSSGEALVRQPGTATPPPFPASYQCGAPHPTVGVGTGPGGDPWACLANILPLNYTSILPSAHFFVQAFPARLFLTYRISSQFTTAVLQTELR